MLLLGPSTESATYVLLGPLLVYALFAARQHPFWIRTAVLMSYGVLLIGLVLNSFLHLKKNVYLKSVQPLGALCFVVYASAWIFSRSRWAEDSGHGDGVHAAITADRGDHGGTRGG